MKCAHLYYSYYSERTADYHYSDSVSFLAILSKRSSTVHAMCGVPRWTMSSCPEALRSTCYFPGGPALTSPCSAEVSFTPILKTFSEAAPTFILVTRFVCLCLSVCLSVYSLPFSVSFDPSPSPLTPLILSLTLSLSVCRSVYLSAFLLAISL